MLVLTRKTDEKIRIGDDIVITVLRTKGKAVRLGIEAPSHMRVLRGEIAFEMEEQSSDVAAEPAVAQVAKVRVPRSEKTAVLSSLAAGGGPLAGFVTTAASAP